MPAVEPGAQAARPQQALGGCGGFTRRIRLASKCKSREQTVCSCRASQSWWSLGTGGAGFDEIHSTLSFHWARWTRFGLSLYQPISLGPVMISLHGVRESKGTSACSYVRINNGNRENWRKNCPIRWNCSFIGRPALRKSSNPSNMSWVVFQSFPRIISWYYCS